MGLGVRDLELCGVAARRLPLEIHRAIEIFKFKIDEFVAAFITTELSDDILELRSGCILDFNHLSLGFGLGLGLGLG